MKTRLLLRQGALIALPGGAGLLFLSYAAPLQWPTVVVYTGLVILLAGLAGVVRPPKWLGVGTRGASAGVALGGAALSGIALMWPVSGFTTASAASRLDSFLPSYDFDERHEAIIQANPERVVAALHELTFNDVGVWRTLGRIRNAAMGATAGAQGPTPSTPVLELINSGSSGFFPLDDAGNEVVFGMAGQPWGKDARPVRLTPVSFREWMPPGNVKIAANFAVEDLGNGTSRLTTETRVQATDDGARRRMARYWRLIYPGSGLIRRGMLEAVRARAERVR